MHDCYNLGLAKAVAFISIEVRNLSDAMVDIPRRNEISRQPDFIKVIARVQVDPQAFTIYGRLLSRKIYYFTAFHLAHTTGIFSASKLFAIVSKIFLLTPTPEFDVKLPMCYSNNLLRLNRATLTLHIVM